jgi:hypothetical protein
MKKKWIAVYERDQAPVLPRRKAAMLPNRFQTTVSARLTRGPGTAEAPLLRGFRSMGAAGFEPATSRV